MNSWPAGTGFGPHLTGRIDGVLGVDRVDDLGNGDVEFGQLIRPDPDPHGVLAGTEDGDAGDSLDPGHLVIDVDVGVVGQEDVVVGTLRGIKGEHDQGGGGGFLHRDPVIADIRRKLRLGLPLAHLGQQLVGIGIGLQVEVDRKWLKRRCWR